VHQTVEKNLIMRWLIVGLTSLSLSLLSTLALAQEEGGDAEVLDEGKHKITFEPFHLTVMKRGRVQGTADIQLVLQLHDNKDYEGLNVMKPQLRADITSALSTLARQRWKVSRPIDPDIISAYLKPFIVHRVGADKLDVYVQQALINPK